jgi:2-oxoglutarate ferredoxin oxidoreductase subunit beta
VDILQPCPSFNRVNTFAWYQERCHELPADYDPGDWDKAMKTAMQWGDQIPVGVIYRNSRTAYEDRFPVLIAGPLVGRKIDRGVLKRFLDCFA